VDQIADILVVVDPTALEQPAVAKAHVLAKRLGAAIELLACDTRYSREMRAARNLAGESDAPRSGGLESLLEELSAPFRAAGIQIETTAITGDPLHERILSWIGNSPADLVVKDTHRHSLAKRTIITNTDWHLIRSCPKPLLLTKAAEWSMHPVFAAAVDPGHANDPSAALDHVILETAASLAVRFDSQLHVIHAYFPATVLNVDGMPLGIGVSAEAVAAEQEIRRAEIERLVGEYHVVVPNLHVDMGVAAQSLPRMAAACRADVLVMGALARSGLKRLIIGSTTERVLDMLPCDALIVKPTDFAANLPF
jgi:universal stress protein E